MSGIAVWCFHNAHCNYPSVGSCNSRNTRGTFARFFYFGGISTSHLTYRSSGDMFVFVPIVGDLCRDEYLSFSHQIWMSCFFTVMMETLCCELFSGLIKLSAQLHYFKQTKNAQRKHKSKFAGCSTMRHLWLCVIRNICGFLFYVQQRSKLRSVKQTAVLRWWLSY